jgi:acyl-CoA thioester hydrolase
MNHSIPVRVYFEDTDAGGVVFYANYLKFAERGRTELLRFLGFENKSLLDRQGLAFVVRHIEADYFKPALLDDELEMRTEVLHLKNASIVMKQSLFRHDLMLFSCTVTMVCVDIKKLLPTRLPDDLRQKFETFIKQRD